MALINCRECGKEISDMAKVCPHCGVPLKKPGKGFAVASLVLGIVSIVYSFSILAASNFNGPKLPIVSLAIYIMIFAVLSLIFGLTAHKKGCTLKKKTAGIILSIISIIFLIAGIIIAL